MAVGVEVAVAVTVEVAVDVGVSVGVGVGVGVGVTGGSRTSLLEAAAPHTDPRQAFSSARYQTF